MKHIVTVQYLVDTEHPLGNDVRDEDDSAARAEYLVDAHFHPALSVLDKEMDFASAVASDEEVHEGSSSDNVYVKIVKTDKLSDE